jgi:hypothetical protein
MTSDGTFSRFGNVSRPSGAQFSKFKRLNGPIPAVIRLEVEQHVRVVERSGPCQKRNGLDRK